MLPNVVVCVVTVWVADLQYAWQQQAQNSVAHQGSIHLSYGAQE